MRCTLRRATVCQRLTAFALALVAVLMLPRVAEADNRVMRCLLVQEKAEKDGAVCIGRIADACSERPQAQSTAGQAECADRELSAWDKLLDTHLNGLMAALDAPLKKQKLQASQALWQKLRDADCGLAYHFFDGGTMAIPMMRYCTMKTTARRALMLRQWQDSLTPR